MRNASKLILAAVDEKRRQAAKRLNTELTSAASTNAGWELRRDLKHPSYDITHHTNVMARYETEIERLEKELAAWEEAYTFALESMT